MHRVQFDKFEKDFSLIVNGSIQYKLSSSLSNILSKNVILSHCEIHTKY